AADVYYVIRVDADTIKLAKSSDDLAKEVAVPLAKPADVGTYRLTPINELRSISLTQNQIKDKTVGTATIRVLELPDHGLVTGQEVRFHLRTGAFPQTSSAADTK